MPDSTVFAEAWFDVGGRTEKQNVRHLCLTQEKGCHELALVKLRRPDTDNSNIFRAGSPVTIKYGREGRMERTFYGYCADTAMHYDRSQTTPMWQTVTIPVLGASLVLKQPFTFTWIDTPIEQIVRQIAQGVMFSTDITDADTVIPFFSNPGKSGWEILRELSELTGLVLWAHNTEIKFFNPYTVITRKRGTSPTFHTQKVRLPETIVTFDAEGGDLVPTDGRHKAFRTLYGVDTITGVPFQQSSGPPTGLMARQTSPTFFNDIEHDVSSSQDWAQSLVDGSVKRNLFSIRAKACLAGDIRVTPAAGVILRGLNTKHNGLWTVQKVTHNLEMARYTMDVVLGRDSMVDLGSLIDNDRRVVRPRLDPFDSTVDLQRPGTSLANGVWRSGWAPKKAVSNA